VLFLLNECAYSLKPSSYCASFVHMSLTTPPSQRCLSENDHLSIDGEHGMSGVQACQPLDVPGYDPEQVAGTPCVRWTHLRPCVTMRGNQPALPEET
jgi:hypothetical protein